MASQRRRRTRPPPGAAPVWHLDGCGALRERRLELSGRQSGGARADWHGLRDDLVRRTSCVGRERNVQLFAPHHCVPRYAPLDLHLPAHYSSLICAAHACGNADEAALAVHLSLVCRHQLERDRQTQRREASTRKDVSAHSRRRPRRSVISGGQLVARSSNGRRRSWAAQGVDRSARTSRPRTW